MSKQDKQVTFKPTAAQEKLGRAVIDSIATLAAVEQGIMADCSAEVWGNMVRARVGGWEAEPLKALVGYSDLPKNTRATMRKALSIIEKAQTLGIALVNGKGSPLGKTAIEKAIKDAEGQPDEGKGARTGEGAGEGEGKGQNPQAGMSKVDMVKAALALLAEDKALRDTFTAEFSKVAEAYSKDRADAAARKVAAKVAADARKADKAAKAKADKERRAKDRDTVNAEIRDLIAKGAEKTGANTIATEPANA